MNTSMGEGKQQLPPGNEGCLHEGARYFPQELIGYHNNKPKTVYYFYLIELQPDFEYEVTPQHIVLAVGKMLDGDFKFNMEADGGKMIVHVKLLGKFTLTREEVAQCRRFQVKLFDLLLNPNLDKYQHSRRKRSPLFNYLLIPALLSHGNASVDWRCIYSVIDPENAASLFDHTKCSSSEVRTKNSLVCRCMLENSVVLYNDALYRIMGILDGVLHGKRIFTVHNYLQRCPIPPEPSSTYKLQPELCLIVMSPISISTFYSFSFLPTVMHRIESLLIAANLKSILAAGHCMQKAEIPAIKVLEAITTKNCQEELHLESLETLGDSFLKYATSQQLFKTHQSRSEGFLTRERQEIISNAALCKRGIDRKILSFLDELISTFHGFIRDEPFHPKTWMIPCVDCDYGLLEEQIFASRKVYTRGSRQMKDKTVADVVEALIGAFLSAAGEKAALSFTVWLGIEVDLAPVPYTRTFVTNPDRHVLGDVIESLAGAIFIDSGHDTKAVFRSMKPLLEPFVTPDTLKIHPKRELNELCQKENYTMQKPVISWHGGLAHATVEVEAGGAFHKETRSAKDRRLAERLACKAVLNSLKESMDKGT